MPPEMETSTALVSLRSRRSEAVRAAWVVRKQTYGGSGYARRGDVCQRGHPLTRENTVRYRHGRRTCRACMYARIYAARGIHRGHGGRPVWIGLQAIGRHGPRPIWVEYQGVRIHVEVHDRACIADGERLRARMLAAHPDAGGTVTAFGSARRAWERFLTRERAWYTRLHLPLPGGLERHAPAPPSRPARPRPRRVTRPRQPRPAARPPVRAKWQQFLAREAAWYAARGLDLPSALRRRISGRMSQAA